MSLERHKYMIDIDGTICKTENSKYQYSVPNYNKKISVEVDVSIY